VKDTGRRTELAQRSLRFYFVGGVGIAVQMLALAMLKSGFQLDYLLATALAVEISVVHNFLWHERFTWAERVTIGWGSLRRLMTFNLTTGAVSILGNVVTMRLLVGQMRVPYLLANGIAIALCSLLNFAVSECYVFRRQPANAGALAPFRLP
jgi:putative flippase GtrA